MDKNDKIKIMDVLVRVLTFHEKRDEMNAELHLAKEVRYSPLTIELGTTLDRINDTDEN